METAREPVPASRRPVVIAWSDNADQVQNVNITITRASGISKKIITVLIVCGISIFTIFAYILLTVSARMTVVPETSSTGPVTSTRIVLWSFKSTMTGSEKTSFSTTITPEAALQTTITSEEATLIYNSTLTLSIEMTSTSTNCSMNEYTCTSSNICLPLDSKCDKRSDCPSADDEKFCTCLDYLTNLFPQRVCDNYPDCPDSSDEFNCSYKCSKDEFRCLFNGDCISRELICDGVENCANGQDESSCWSLAPAIEALDDPESLDTYFYGYLFGRIRGIWYPACIDLDITVAETRDLCSALGFRELISFHSESVASKTQTVINFTRYHDISMSPQDVLSDDCSSNSFAKMQCQGETDCGSRPLCGPNLKRIVGGGPAGPFCQPWIVALYKDGELTCQAVVFNHEWLLTAAHCFYETTSSTWIARLGFHRQHSQSPYEQIRSINYVAFHPKFTDTPLEVNDLALLKMDRPVHFGPHLKPPCLPSIDIQGPSGPVPGDTCVASGWGYDHENSRRTVDELRSVVLTSVDVDVCNGSGPFKGLLTEGHLCFNSGTQWPKDACQGDSGGPMMCYSEQHDKLYLAGITSAGFGCARSNTASLWTKVSHYMPWILSTLNASDDRALVKINNTPCPDYRCSYGDCIPRKKLCDGTWDCRLSGEDELDCAYPEPLFNDTVHFDHVPSSCPWKSAVAAEIQCSPTDILPGPCLKSYRLCDSFMDCPNGEDEFGCEATSNYSRYL